MTPMAQTYIMDSTKSIPEDKKDELKRIIYEKMRESYEAKLRELPPPPAGFCYFPDDYEITREGENYVIDVQLVLKPIIDE